MFFCQHRQVALSSSVVVYWHLTEKIVLPFVYCNKPILNTDMAEVDRNAWKCAITFAWYLKILLVYVIHCNKTWLLSVLGLYLPLTLSPVLLRPPEDRDRAGAGEADPEWDVGSGGAARCPGGPPGGAAASGEGRGQGPGGRDALQRLQPQLGLKEMTHNQLCHLWAV